MKTAVFTYAAKHCVSVKSALEFVMRKTLLVTRWQLADFLPEGKYGSVLPAHIQEELEHCPLTNWSGKNTSGEVDSEKKLFLPPSVVNQHDEAQQNIKVAKPQRCWWNVSTSVHSTQKNQATEGSAQPEGKSCPSENQRKTSERVEEADKGSWCSAEEGWFCSESSHKQWSLQPYSWCQQACLQVTSREEEQGSDENSSARWHQIPEGSLAELENARKDYFSTDPQDAAHMPADPPAQSSEDEDAAVSQPKHPRLDSHCDYQDATDIAPPAFTVQGEWVAVYFDNQFYVGEVIDVHSPSETTVQYLEQMKSHKDYFRHSKTEDVARTEAQFVFRWNLQVDLVSNGSRVWKVSDIDDICEAYCQLKGST